MVGGRPGGPRGDRTIPAPWGSSRPPATLPQAVTSFNPSLEMMMHRAIASQAARRRGVNRAAREPVVAERGDGALQPAAEAGDAEYRRADLDLSGAGAGLPPARRPD
jgi:hypothetical protein